MNFEKEMRENAKKPFEKSPMPWWRRFLKWICRISY
jgi:hypothetical protein